MRATRRWRGGFASVVAFVALVVGCSKPAPSGAIESNADSGGSPRLDAEAPPQLAKIGTTSPSIALGNLDAQIEGREQAIKRNAGDVAAAKTRIDLLLARGEYTGVIADYERADALAEKLASDHPASPEALLARAATLGTFHRFDEELRALDAAEAAHAPAPAVNAARAAAYLAQGKFDAAIATGAWNDEATLDPMGLASAAVLAAERGKIDDSERLFAASRAKFRDVSPFPLAWMDFQHGQLLERRGDRARAKELFAEAHAALPTYVHAATHLAGLVSPAEAIAILEPLTKTSDDPQVDAAYADALRRVGRRGDEAAVIARASKRYDALLRAHPRAFADHAAQLYLGLGHDAPRALTLARDNAKERRTEPAIDLWLSAALANGAKDDTCAAAAAARALPWISPDLRATLDAARATCPDASDAPNGATTRDAP